MLLYRNNSFKMKDLLENSIIAENNKYYYNLILYGFLSWCLLVIAYKYQQMTKENQNQNLVGNTNLKNNLFPWKNQNENGDLW